MWTEVPAHATWCTCGEDQGREWEGSLLLWDQGWALGRLHVDVKAKHTFAFEFQYPARQANSSSVLILIIRIIPKFSLGQYG